MDFSGLTNYEFFISLGYVTIVASVITMIITQIIKTILKKRNIIAPHMDASQKDAILARTGRITALIVYSALYLGNEYYLKHAIVFDGTLMTGLLSGATLTLTIAKGLYTMLHQYQEKKTVYERLKYAQEAVQKLSEPIEFKLGYQSAQPVVESIVESLKESKEKANTETKKWTLTNKQ